MKTAAMRVTKLPEANIWRVEMQYDMSDGQRMDLCINVSIAHPSPRVSDLERLAVETAHNVLGHTLEALPVRQDK